jgi:hypothetical protein
MAGFQGYGEWNGTVEAETQPAHPSTSRADAIDDDAVLGGPGPTDAGPTPRQERRYSGLAADDSTPMRHRDVLLTRINAPSRPWTSNAHRQSHEDEKAVISR